MKLNNPEKSNDNSPIPLKLPNAAIRACLTDLRNPGTLLVMSDKLTKAAVMEIDINGELMHRKTLHADLVKEMLFHSWIFGKKTNGVGRYRLSDTGRRALQYALAQTENHSVNKVETDFEDEPTDGSDSSLRQRLSPCDAPILALSRRKDKNGKPFLTRDLIQAGERLREDFECAHIGTRIARDWSQYLTGGVQSKKSTERSLNSGFSAKRFKGAMDDLGPGLSEIALLCCCYQEGLENAEKKMGWSARSAKIVLKIALQHLKAYYEDLGENGELIG